MTEITKGTLIRTFLLVTALLNQLLLAAGYPVLPMTEQLQEMAGAVLTSVAALWAWWKNNSFTQRAQLADQLLLDLRQLDRQARGLEP